MIKSLFEMVENEDILGLCLNISEFDFDIDVANSSGETMLLHAVRLDRKEAVNILISEGANPNIGDRSQVTPLQVAVSNKDVEMVSILLRSKKIDVTQTGRWGNGSPLDNAVGCPDILNMLLDRLEADGL